MTAQPPRADPCWCRRRPAESLLETDRCTRPGSRFEAPLALLLAAHRYRRTPPCPQDRVQGPKDGRAPALDMEAIAGSEGERTAALAKSAPIHQWTRPRESTGARQTGWTEPLLLQTAAADTVAWHHRVTEVAAVVRRYTPFGTCTVGNAIVGGPGGSRWETAMSCFAPAPADIDGFVVDTRSFLRQACAPR